MKIKIHEILFSNEEVKKKRIAIRKLRSKKLEDRFIKLFLNLLEYIQETINTTKENDL